jgi:hypothetical protein
MSMKKTTRLVYVLMNFPVGCLGYVEDIYIANKYITKMYEENIDNYLSKRDLERLGNARIPCGPRFKLFPYEMKEDFFKTSRYDEKRGGPDIIDRMREEYLKNFKNESNKKME